MLAGVVGGVDAAQHQLAPRAGGVVAVEPEGEDRLRHQLLVDHVLEGRRRASNADLWERQALPHTRQASGQQKRYLPFSKRGHTVASTQQLIELWQAAPLTKHTSDKQLDRRMAGHVKTVRLAPSRAAAHQA